MPKLQTIGLALAGAAGLAVPAGLAARPIAAGHGGRLRVPGLQLPVQVLRDRWACRISTPNRRTTRFAQGYVHAQD